MRQDPAPFDGFHPEALAFFRDLAADNSRAFWEANRDVYQAHVRAPLEALAASLQGLFGDPHLFRPYRDLRFSKDKRPYKEQAALAFGGRGPGAIGTRYLQLDRHGVFLAAGAYRLERDTLAAYRRAVAQDRPARELERVLAALVEGGYELHGESLKRAPRGVPLDHPQLDLLKRKGIAAGTRLTPEDGLFRPDIADRVVRVFADAEPLVAWLRAHLT